MLSAAENIRLTSSGPGTAGGALLRQYWQPVALSEELDPTRPLKCVALLGEPLVLFRDEHGELGLIERHCPHRGADLSYGRLEDGGLRCVFHGWLFDAHGNCLQQPAEPLDSRMHEHIQQRAYPCLESNGVIFAYLGEGSPPKLPALDCLHAPHSHVFAFKGMMECNWMQALEVGIDPAHASYLHRFLADDDPDDAYGKQFRAKTALTDMPLTQLLREYPRPRINVEDTPFGLRLLAVRELDAELSHIRVTNLLFPQAIVIPMSDSMTITQWHVPIDDRRCFWYAMFTSFDEPVDHVRMREQRLELYQLPDYVPRVGRHNDYGFDPQQQRTQTYTGMGEDINVHDQWAVESMGALQDRTREHLGHSDVAIRAFRNKLAKAIDACATSSSNAPGPVFDHASQPFAVDAIGTTAELATYWRERERERRQATTWMPR